MPGDGVVSRTSGVICSSANRSLSDAVRESSKVLSALEMSYIRGMVIVPELSSVKLH